MLYTIESHVKNMEKIILDPAVGELDGGSDPAMSMSVATEGASGVDVKISGITYQVGETVEQARGIFELFEEVIVNDLGGDLSDVTIFRFHVQEDVFTTELRQELHELRHDLFEYPDYPPLPPRR